MKRVGLSIGVAVAVATLAVPAFASAGTGTTRAFRGAFGETVVGVPATAGCAGASPRSTTLPPQLVSLERRMVALRLNTARIATKTITREPRGEATERLFEQVPRKHLSRRQARRIVAHTVGEGVEEASESPALERIRDRWASAHLGTPRRQASK